MIEQLPLLDKRWNRRRQVFVPPTERIDPSAYNVQPIPTAAARAFVTDHHYSSAFVAARANVGLFREGGLVGVATFSHPMSDKVLTKYLGHRDGCELGRFVLLDSEPFTSVMWNSPNSNIRSTEQCFSRTLALEHLTEGAEIQAIIPAPKGRAR